MKQRNGYMIISIKTLNKIIKKARQESKSMYGKIEGKSNISLDLIIEEDDTYNASDSAKQVNVRNF